MTGEGLVVVVGRGHSGTRAFAEILRRSGAWMGPGRNSWEDVQPATPLYHLARAAGRRVERISRFRWSWRRLVEEPIPDGARELLTEHLAMYEGATRPAGWKLPETTLAYPWIVRMLPRARFLHVLRDPRDTILKPHGTDDLTEWGLEASEPTVRLRRVESWLYHYRIVEQTPAPARLLEVRLKDFVADGRGVVDRVCDFAGLPPVERHYLEPRPEVVGRWRTSPLRGGERHLRGVLEARGWV